MPRRREVPKRETLPDPAFGSTLITKFINCMMVQGKKSVAEGAFYGSLELVKERTKEDPVKVFKKAVENSRPLVEVKSRRVGGSTYQVPTEIIPARKVALTIRWILSFAAKRSEKSMSRKLAGELMDAAEERGGAIKKRDDTHKMAEANKAFAHYRW